MGVRSESAQGISSDASRSKLDSLYRAYHESIRYYLTGRFGAGPPDPEDAVHAAFEQFAAVDRRAQVANPRAFLIRIAHNYMIDQHRRQAVRVQYALSTQVGGEATDDFDAERVLSAKERWAILEETIRGMDDRHRDVLIMHRIQGLNCAEIARRRNYSATMVKRLLAQALLICERALREADEDVC
jgi:RNA polymerase sigma-70 factor (ECF subfamily)